MAIEKSAVYQIKKLINSYFNQEEELISEGVDNGFLNLLEIILKPSDSGKKIYNNLISRANRQNRKNPNSKIYKDIYSLLYNQMKNNKLAFERGNVKQLASVIFMTKVHKAGQLRDALSNRRAATINIINELIKVANSLDKKGLYKEANNVDVILTKYF